MGLDMYLKKHEILFRKGDGSLTSDRSAYRADEFGVGNIVSVESTVAYWRKANAIHKWFVDNLQEGIDECQETGVTAENLKDLRAKCMEVLAIVDGKTLLSKDAGTMLVVKTDDLRALRQVLANARCETFMGDATAARCNEVLPTQAGFFFGQTKYGNWYLLDIVDTVLQIDRVLMTAKDADLSYRASW